MSGASGGFASCIVATVSYVAAAVGPSARTGRVALIEAMTFAGGAVGPLLAGFLLPLTSHAAVFTLIAMLNLMAVSYALLFLSSGTTHRYVRVQCLQKLKF